MRTLSVPVLFTVHSRLHARSPSRGRHNRSAPDRRALHFCPRSDVRWRAAPLPATPFSTSMEPTSGDGAQRAHATRSRLAGAYLLTPVALPLPATLLLQLFD